MGTNMLIHAQDRPGYQKPEYRQGQTPPFLPTPADASRQPVNVEAELARWQKPMAAAPELIDRELALIRKHVTLAEGKGPTGTPYTNAYVRSLDGALMIELPGWGTFVSETWAVSAGYISAPSKSEEALAARQEARKDRKAGQKAGKQEAVKRKHKRIQKARQKEMLS